LSVRTIRDWPRRRIPIALVVVGLLALGGAPAEPGASAAEPVARHLVALESGFPPAVTAALEAIDGTGRRLLAARSYLRSVGRLESQWSWSAEEAAAFERSPAKAALDAAVAAVRCEFEAANPGHSLFVNPSLRTLEVQLDRWNRNESVAEAAANLLQAAREAVAKDGLGEPVSSQARAAFRRWLVEHTPSPTPPLAAPGLSRHGRGLAIDFQVQSGSRIVADASVATIGANWEEPGWSARLRSAVEAAGAGFVGPLPSPYEPWHYDYAPRLRRDAGRDGAATARCAPEAGRTSPG
jgi:hypothetical protein